MTDTNRQNEIRRANLGLIASLGLFSTVMFVVGSVIGSGIFRKPGVMASQIGSPEVLIGVWLVAGLITLIGALVNAEIAAMIPEAGGQYVFFHRMYGPLAAYLFGWANFAVINTGGIASLSFIFAEAIAQFVKLPELPASIAALKIHLPFIGDIYPLANAGGKGVAASLIIVLTLVNYLGVKFGSIVQNIFAVAKTAALGAIILIAFFTPETGRVAHLATDSEIIRPTGLAMWAAVAAALSGAFWAYEGWNTVTFIAGEVKQPQRNLPRGLILGMAIVIAVYLLANLAYAWVLPIDEMAKSKLVAADVVEKCFRGGGRWIAVGIMISTFGAVSSNVLAGARVYFSMARRNVFPQSLGRAHVRFHTPGASLIVQALWSILLLFSGTFDTITDTLVFVAWIFYAAGAYGLFVLRRKEPDTPRPYKVIGYPWLPWIFIVFAATFLVLTIYNDVSSYRAAVSAGKPAIINCAFGTFLVLLGTPIYFFYRASKVKQPDRPE